MMMTMNSLTMVVMRNKFIVCIVFELLALTLSGTGTGTYDRGPESAVPPSIRGYLDIHM
jgi:hypothetical protein